MSEFSVNGVIHVQELTGPWVGFNITRYHQQHLNHQTTILRHSMEWHRPQDQLVEVELMRAVAPNSSCLKEAEEYACMIHNSSLLHGRNCNCYCLMCLQAPLIEGAYKVHVDVGGVPTCVLPII